VPARWTTARRSFRRSTFESQPSAIRGKIASTKDARRQHHVGRRDLVLDTIGATAPSGQSAAYVPVVAKCDERDWLADHKGVAGDDEVMSERLTERAQLLVLAAPGCRYGLDQFVEPGERLRIAR
jgi:hypothetical protein